MGDLYGQFDVTKTLSANLDLRDFDATTVAYYTSIADALVLAAVAVPVLDRTENALAEQPIALWFEGAIVDRLGLGDLPLRPSANSLGRSELNADGIEISWFARCIGSL